MRKERIDSLKFMRVVAMNLVVLIHVTGPAMSNVPYDHYLYDVYMILNQFTRFEGAVFVFLSGLVLFYNYEDRPNTLKTWLVFYRRRFMFILGPYIFWSLFYEGFSYYMGYRQFEGFDAIFNNLLVGGSFYQLYFIMILVQLFFLTPLFIYLIKRFRFLNKYMFIVGFVLEVTHVFINFQTGWVTFPFFMSYLGSFLFGGWVGVHYQKLKNMWSGRSLLLFAIMTISFGLIDIYGRHFLYRIGDPFLPIEALVIIRVLFNATSCYLLFKIGMVVERKAAPFILNGIERLRIYSFGFYLVHPFILALWSKVLVPETFFQFNLFLMIKYFLVLISCYLFIRSLHLLFPKAWFLFGNLPSPK
ncbi:acyltransferase [Jeotgalibacillus aurantiacus]|uniref:acyltransferase n=1 Tax=Jeotgalibacillus aurantiacus TaxID=2763266 RepID=UPI001D09A33C|nr:acyltransferase [Jeotgalibacillus aurantiacus]